MRLLAWLCRALHRIALATSDRICLEASNCFGTLNDGSMRPPFPSQNQAITMKRRIRFFTEFAAVVATGALLTGCGQQSESPVAKAGHDATQTDVMAASENSPKANTQDSADGKHAEVSPLFENPVRIRAGGEIVAVESPGYACPTMADVDGDGKQDLVVGQFRNGNMQFCKNVASENEPPQFAKAEWLMSGDDRATVPGVW